MKVVSFFHNPVIKAASLIILATSISNLLFAANRFWVGNGLANNWNNTANWSTSSGGAGGASVPGASDRAIFDGAGTGAFKLSCTLDMNVSVGGIRSDVGFAGGTFAQSGGFTMAVSGGLDFNWNAGSYNGGMGSVSVGTGSAITIAGGSVILSTGGFTATGSGGFDVSGGIFTVNGGSFSNDKVFTISAGTFNGGTGNLDFNGTMHIDGGSFQSTTDTIFMSGNSFSVSNTPSWVHNNGTINFDGTASTDMQFAGNTNAHLNFYKVVVNKTGATNATDNLNFSDIDTMVIASDLNLIDGEVLKNGADIQVQGNIKAGPSFSGSNVDLEITGAGNQTLNFDAAVYDLWDGNFTINKPNANSTLTLQSAFKLDAGSTQKIIFAKGYLVTTATNLLTVGDNDIVNSTLGLNYYVSNDSSFVEGPVQKDGNDYFSFPVGNLALKKAAPIHISGTSSFQSTISSVTSFTGQYFHADPNSGGFTRTSKVASLDNIQACEYWILNRVSGTANAFVWLSYEPQPSAGVHSCGPNWNNAMLNSGPLVVSKWSGTQWLNLGISTVQYQTYGSEVLFASNAIVTSFSPFTTASTVSTVSLPLSLTYFNATPKDCKAELKWATADESGGKDFLIEQSEDGIHFTTVSDVEAKGIPSAYSLILDQATDHASYRLQMRDKNGSLNYSQVVAVDLHCGKGIDQLSIYPNLLARGADLNIIYKSAGNKGESYLKVFDLSGRTVIQTSLFIKNGDNQYSIPGSRMQPGTYFLFLYGSGWKTNTQKLVIQ